LERKGIRTERDDIQSINPSINPSVPEQKSEVQTALEILQKQRTEMVVRPIFPYVQRFKDKRLLGNVEQIAKLDKNERYYHRTDEQLVQFANWKPEFEK